MWEMISNVEKNLWTNKSLEEAYEQLLTFDKSDFCNLKMLKESFFKAKEQLSSFDKSSFDQIVIIGLGGSSLGSRALFQALNPEMLENHKVIFFDNIDARSFERKLTNIKDKNKTLWIPISKSGSTIETLTILEFLVQWLGSDYNYKDQFVVITEENNKRLHKWAKSQSCLTFNVPEKVGGRFSVLSVVGTVPAYLLGLDVASIFEGAESALNHKEHLFEVTHIMGKTMDMGCEKAYVFPYCDDLSSWALWLQQLWAESLGKLSQNDGTPAKAMSVPIPIRGATDQHSVLQQIQEGQFLKSVILLRSESAEAGINVLRSSIDDESLMIGRPLGELLAYEAMGTLKSLDEKGTPYLSLKLSELDERLLGALFMKFEFVIAMIGVLNNINPFDQPGVERSKQITKKLLTLA